MVEPESPATGRIGVVRVDEANLVVAAPVGDGVSWDQPDQQIAEPGLVTDTALEVPAHTVWFHVFTWMRNIGIVVLLFLVWQLWGTSIAQHYAQSQLSSYSKLPSGPTTCQLGRGMARP